MSYADLHVHTSSSDGMYTPADTVTMAVRQGVSVLAITDHDTVAGVAEAYLTAKASGLRFIHGVELSTCWRGEEVHILGYNIDISNLQLLSILDKLRTARSQRSRLIISKLKCIGYAITWDEVLATAENSSSMGRPHIARVLVSKGYVDSMSQAFESLLNSGCPAYVERYKLTAPEAFQLIIDAGGLPFLAHPGLLHDGITTARDLCSRGLMGVEVFHSDHDQSQEKQYLNLCENTGLYVSGGSDCHGTALLGTVRLPLKWIQPWAKFV